MEEGVDCRWPMQPTMKECFRKLWNNFLFKFAIANKKFNTIIKILKNRRDLRHIYLKLSYFTFFNDSAFSQRKLFWHPRSHLMRQIFRIMNEYLTLFHTLFSKNQQKLLYAAAESFLSVVWCSKLYQNIPWTLRTVYHMKNCPQGPRNILV